ncbi:hypothetical protein RZS08_20295, partial [Arthrospira platensis SPKY1]|nr:hypothetical protein [Arthrospira platensis SPKY1]
NERRVLVEEYVAGNEYRATVVGGRCVAVSLRRYPVVTGDGAATLQALVAQLNQRNAGHPYLDPLDKAEIMADFLARSGRSWDTIPQPGEQVQLANTSYGVDHEDATATAPPALKSCAEAAARAIGLINCGIDIIVDDAGEPFVLELNQRAYIGMHSFP